MMTMRMVKSATVYYCMYYMPDAYFMKYLILSLFTVEETEVQRDKWLEKDYTGSGGINN